MNHQAKTTIVEELLAAEPAQQATQTVQATPALDQVMAEQDRAAMRVKIALDTIAQVCLGKWRAMPGLYYSRPDDVERLHTGRMSRFAKTKECEVCAIGAVFAATASVENRRGISILNKDFSRLNGIVTKYFDDRTLADMESCFEGYNESPCRISVFQHHNGDYNMDTRSINGTDWVTKYQDPADRLAAIMTNIVIHNGQFNPGYIPQPDELIKCSEVTRNIKANIK